MFGRWQNPRISHFNAHERFAYGAAYHFVSAKKRSWCPVSWFLPIHLSLFWHHVNVAPACCSSPSLLPANFVVWYHPALSPTPQSRKSRFGFCALSIPRNFVLHLFLISNDSKIHLTFLFSIRQSILHHDADWQPYIDSHPESYFDSNNPPNCFSYVCASE